MATDVAEHLMTLDYAILSVLPDAGSRLGYHDICKQARQIARNLNDDQDRSGVDAPKITGAQINGRLRSLKHLGLVASIATSPTVDGLGWQRSPDGKALAKDFQNPTTKETP